MIEFIFVNKNPLIPIVINNITKQKALTMLMEQTFNQNNEYCKNIYFISFCSNNTFQIYFTNGKEKKYFIKRDNSNNIEEYDIDSSFGFNTINKFLNKNNIMNEIEIEIESDNEEINLDLSNKKENKDNEVFELDMGLFSKSNSNKDKYLKNNNIEENIKLDIGLFTKNNEDNEENEDTDVFDDCEKLMKRFYEDKNRKDEIKKRLMIDKKEEHNLLKKKRELVQDKIVELKGKYRTYKNIKDDMEDEEINISELFNIEFEYFEKMNDEDREIIDKLDDNDIMNKNVFNERVVEMANEFKIYMGENINPLESRFEHNWSELDNDIIVGEYKANI
jgi:hypothetical protein